METVLLIAFCTRLLETVGVLRLVLIKREKSKVLFIKYIAIDNLYIPVLASIDDEVLDPCLGFLLHLMSGILCVIVAYNHSKSYLRGKFRDLFLLRNGKSSMLLNAVYSCLNDASCDKISYFLLPIFACTVCPPPPPPT